MELRPTGHAYPAHVGILPQQLGHLRMRGPFAIHFGTFVRCISIMSCFLTARLTLPALRNGFRRKAVVENDEHCQAVNAWLNDFVIGRDFCPWAKPAQKRKHVRIVTSTGVDPEDVLEDLLDEAEALPEKSACRKGEKTTTLLVCPHVKEWEDYGPFRDFYEEDLEAGDTFVHEFNMKIIAFHPKFLKYGFSVEAGDRIAIARADGTSCSATVLDEEGGIHPDDEEELLSIRLDHGQDLLVRYSAIITKLGRTEQGEEVPANDGTGDAANLLSRAPRPTLHLLRMEDLQAASSASKAGTGPNIKQVLEANAERASSISLEYMADMLGEYG
ncbi:unnamed protein product [Durusdinium trenchii]|uniref:Uncharacterized protein n=2 Tax=Durusdinium trenchii TaxID=1381693 RepID=A0ABP0JY82_9DINO